MTDRSNGGVPSADGSAAETVGATEAHGIPIHTRTITCNGRRLPGNLWQIEGELLDTKAYDVPSRVGGAPIVAGSDVHRMRAALVVDDDLIIHRIDVETVSAPFSPCGSVDATFSELVGLGLRHGFVKALRTRFAGVLGCTHVIELLSTMATVAFQTVYPVLSRERPEEGRPAVIDSCCALAADGPVVAVAWPQYAAGGPLSSKGG